MRTIRGLENRPPSVYPERIMTRRLAILTLIAMLIPTFLVPGRVALCLGDCGCGTAQGVESGADVSSDENASADLSMPCSCCSCCSSSDLREASAAQEGVACGCNVVTSPRREDRPSCPDCAVFERGFGESTSPESFDWECPSLRALPQLIAIFSPAPAPRRPFVATPRDPRDPPPRPLTPLRV